MITSADVIVVGAGPAGSIAAQRLASQGVSVILLDQAVFPRDKTCGDGVGSRGLAVLERSGLAEWSRQYLAPEVMRLNAPDGEMLEVRPDKHDYCFGRVIPRTELDAALAQQTVKNGAVLHEAQKVTDITIEPNAVLASANGSRYSAQLLILAEGSRGTLSQRLGLVQSQPDLYALRQYYRNVTQQTVCMEFHFQPWILPGYTWIFPMKDGWANVGTGTFTCRLKREGVNLKQYLARFAAEQQSESRRLWGAAPDGEMKGFPLRTTLGSISTHSDRLLLAGDAAGLVNPMSGEGISAGMESSEIAARAATQALQTGRFKAADLAGYTRSLTQQFLLDWRAARLFRQVLKMPTLLNHIFRRMRQDPRRALHFAYLLLNDTPQRNLLQPLYLLRFLS